jgi:hypothetical protein
MPNRGRYRKVYDQGYEFDRETPVGVYRFIGFQSGSLYWISASGWKKVREAVS